MSLPRHSSLLPPRAFLVAFRAFSSQLTPAAAHPKSSAPAPESSQSAPSSVRWWHVDATGKVAGRLASHLAHILQGKHKPTYDRSKMNGDIVVVSNVEKLMFTGKKMTDKEYIHHTLHPGGLKRIPLPQMLDRHPDRILSRAVHGMLPPNSLRDIWMKNLRVFSGATPHPHAAQQPQELFSPDAVELWRRAPAMLNFKRSPHMRKEKVRVRIAKAQQLKLAKKSGK
jgi:large subunit ribosomal protein L13